VLSNVSEVNHKHRLDRLVIAWVMIVNEVVAQAHIEVEAEAAAKVVVWVEIVIEVAITVPPPQISDFQSCSHGPRAMRQERAESVAEAVAEGVTGPWAMRQERAEPVAEAVAESVTGPRAMRQERVGLSELAEDPRDPIGPA
jgi:hypothetical protein